MAGTIFRHANALSTDNISTTTEVNHRHDAEEIVAIAGLIYICNDEALLYRQKVIELGTITVCSWLDERVHSWTFDRVNLTNREQESGYFRNEEDITIEALTVLSAYRQFR